MLEGKAEGVRSPGVDPFPFWGLVSLVLRSFTIVAIEIRVKMAARHSRCRIYLFSYPTLPFSLLEEGRKEGGKKKNEKSGMNAGSSRGSPDGEG